ncbi:AAA family ATPase [Nannocystis punicea]|uniref:AAA family ATPase n=1 Tax=Nannocystis punicea TaxID=2995304 RepID=A0ABY7H556_9BACT|nr:AAA family ATPase [Nannocystis poenicansa]WAS94220.1 AAA family ATPase [Nannocystis poenicansa]
MLIALSGLPGVGKTTLARALAARTGGVHLRIDTIEQALVRDGLPAADLHGRGYAVARALAGDLLAAGFTVVADAVNPIAATRTAWHDLARAADVACRDVEIVCTDLHEHRRRFEARVADIPGHRLPTWADVQARVYEPWLTAPRVVVDTAQVRDDPVEQVVAALGLDAYALT